jgi:membrane-associated phospholipid phosphatase
LAVLSLTAVSFRYLDAPLARFCLGLARSVPRWSSFTGDLPDLLLPASILGTVAAWGGYGLLRVRHLDGRGRPFLKHVAVSLPASFLAKTALKGVFGRIATRAWLQSPGDLGFAWFSLDPDKSGFPSGHMTVATAVAAAVCAHFPAYRRPCLGLLALLAVLLVLTDYHFLSDVVAGAGLGVLVHVLARPLAERLP